MSSTNLTDGKSRVCFFMISGRNYLKEGEKAGDASKVKPEDAKNLPTNLGVSTMVIPVKEDISIDREGHRGDNSQRQDMEKMDYKVERMEKINAAKLKEKEAKKKDSNTEHDDR